MRFELERSAKLFSGAARGTCRCCDRCLRQQLCYMDKSLSLRHGLRRATSLVRGRFLLNNIII